MLDALWRKKRIEAPKLVKRSSDAEAEKYISDTLTQPIEKIAEFLTYADTALSEEPEKSRERRAEIVRSFARLVFELREHISGYDMLVVDDTRGRLPGVAMGRIIRRIREERGLQGPKALFVKGGAAMGGVGGLLHKTLVEERISELERPHRALLLTECIASGRSIYELAKILERNKVSFDIGALNVYKQFHTEVEKGSYMEAWLTQRLYYGGHADSPIYWQPMFTGLDKHFTAGAHAKARDLNDAEQQIAASARESMRALADALLPIVENAKPYEKPE